MSQTEKVARNSSYDILKLFLALLVIFSHSYELILPVTGKSAVTLFNRSPGNVAVHAFFVLSGYFITMSCQRARDTGDFIWKRIIRLAPGYLLAMLFSHWIADLCNHFSDLPTPYIINGCVWTLYYEIVLYILVALLKSWKLLTKETVGALGCVLLLVAFLQGSSTEMVYAVVLPMVIMFVCGSYIYLAQMEITLSRMVPFAAIGLLAVQFAPEVFKTIEREIPLIYGPSIGLILMQLAYLLSLPIVVLWIGQAAHITFKAFPDLSYGIYLLGWPIQQGIIYVFQSRMLVLTPVALLGLSLIATLLAACISWYVVEKHAMKLKNGYVFTKKKMDFWFSGLSAFLKKNK